MRFEAGDTTYRYDDVASRVHVDQVLAAGHNDCSMVLLHDGEVSVYGYRKTAVEALRMALKDYAGQASGHQSEIVRHAKCFALANREIGKLSACITQRSH